MTTVDALRVTSANAINAAIEALTQNMGKMTVDEVNARANRAKAWVEIAKELREQGR